MVVYTAAIAVDASWEEFDMLNAAFIIDHNGSAFLFQSQFKWCIF